MVRLPNGVFSPYTGIRTNLLFFTKGEPTKEVWYYDYRTNIHHTLKRKPLRLEDLREFVACYNPANRQKRKETWHPEKNPDGRWRKFAYAELVARDKASLDIFWLKDDSLADSDNLPPPEVIAQEIVEDLEAALEQFRLIAADPNRRVEDGGP